MLNNAGIFIIKNIVDLHFSTTLLIFDIHFLYSTLPCLDNCCCSCHAISSIYDYVWTKKKRPGLVNNNNSATTTVTSIGHH